jgi:hypothetical protein
MIRFVEFNELEAGKCLILKLLSKTTKDENEFNSKIYESKYYIYSYKL